MLEPDPIRRAPITILMTDTLQILTSLGISVMTSDSGVFTYPRITLPRQSSATVSYLPHLGPRIAGGSMLISSQSFSGRVPPRSPRSPPPRRAPPTTPHGVTS